jgi:ParB family transcriptional regulator, chromosome partitioning protein
MSNLPKHRFRTQPETLVLVNPFRCRMWAMHDRIEEHLTEESCKAEIESFARQGQLLPVLGRRLHGERDFDIELVYGARRLYVARHLNKELQVRVQDIPDHAALIAMELENRQRQDVSPYERGLSYCRILRDGYFSSQEELSRAFGVSPSYVCRVLKIARLPAVVVSAFENPTVITEAWGLALVEALEDPARRAVLVQRARAMREHGRSSAREVFERLIAPVGQASTNRHSGPGVRRRPAEIVTGKTGRVLFRVQQRRKAVVLTVPSNSVPPHVLEEIRKAVATILEHNHTSNGYAGSGVTKYRNMNA